MLADPETRASTAVHEATRRARHLGRPILASVTEPSTLDALSFFGQAADTSERSLWLRPSTGEALVGIGAAHTLTGTGASRFSQVIAGWRDLLADAVLDDQATGGPLLLGGFSFDPLREPSSVWSGFGDARLVLPERTLVVRDGAAWLTTNVLVHPNASFERPPAEPGAPPDQADELGLTPAQWTALVDSVTRGMRSGQVNLTKVVLARAQRVALARAIDPQVALRNLAANYPSCTVFAIAHGRQCFLGATPERLIALQDGTASTVALAGSVPRGATPDEDDRLADQLLRSPKERAEHAIVVEALRDGLAEVCTRVIADSQPRVSKLSNVQHLLTPIRGQVSPGIGVLDLVERLHPTPAMGGFPRAAALELIRSREGLDRGWYAGPIGWLNRHGDGEFVVGIRSALVHGTAAMLFAGCGIVADSDPATELAELGWKLSPMRTALGVPR